MDILIACEASQVVLVEMLKRGHNAYSCDLIPAYGPRPDRHIQGDAIVVLRSRKWDLVIAHPPCTYLTVAGNRSYANRPDLYEPAADFAKMFFDYAGRVCVENPVGRLSTLWRKPDQYIQPWQFGHKESKKTGLWLKNLPKLEETNNVYDEMMKLPLKERTRIHYMSPGPRSIYA